MACELPPLPYAEDALEPTYSARTIRFHYGKHHQAYLDNLCRLTAGTELECKPVCQVVRTTFGDAAKTAIFNNAAQVWNHTFFWSSMKPGGGGEPPADLAAKLTAAFGSVDAFREQFKAAAVGRFGSGWAWLVVEDGELRIMTTPNAETPIATGQKPLLTVDVWEHAYYLDYQNRRADFVQAFLDKLVNWDFAEANLKG
jgi:Fe-Mn family superoxide dismutase